jgi:hypothetical protein
MGNMGQSKQRQPNDSRPRCGRLIGNENRLRLVDSNVDRRGTAQQATLRGMRRKNERRAMIVLHAANDDGTRNLIVVLTADNIAALQEKQPLSVDTTFPTFPANVKAIGIAYATDAEMMQYLQLGRQGKTADVIAMVTSGWVEWPQ